MPSFAVIGLGNFGYYVSRFLSEFGFEILAIDSDEAQVDRVKSFVDKAVIADATNKEALQQLGIKDMDGVVVSVGDRIDASVLITLYLREMKVKNIIVKAITEDHGRILNLIGATEITFPERDIAAKMAQSLANPYILDSLNLGPEYAIVEMAPPNRFLRKSLRELDIRNKYNIQVVAIKEMIPENLIPVPSADHIIKDSDILLVIGKLSDIEKIKKLD